MNATEPYKAILRSLRPLKKMNYQWNGFLAVCTLLLGVAVYNYARLQGRVDILEQQLEAHTLQVSIDITKLKNTCEHVSPPRMLQIDIRDAQQDHDIERLKKKHGIRR